MQILRLSQNIKTFTEGADPGHSDIAAIRESFFGARIIVFLGFAFHKLNVELMHIGRKPTPSTAEVYGTAWDMSESDVDIISRDLVRKFGIALGNIKLRSDKKCVDLIKEYRRTLGLT